MKDYFTFRTIIEMQLKFEPGKLKLFVQFSLMSFLAFGGASAVIPEIYRQSVVLHHWIRPDEFTTLYALGRTIPGPNFLFVTLVGVKAAGFLGGVIATLAMALPSSILTYSLANFWNKYESALWKQSILVGISSVIIGFICASTYFLIISIDTTYKHALITIASALVSYIYKKISPLWLIGGGAIIGWLIF